MKKILVFEPWHLGDVAVALSSIKPYIQSGVEFTLVCNQKWQRWPEKAGRLKRVVGFNAPWTQRYNKQKYNPFNYSLFKIQEFRKEVLKDKPDIIVELRNDIRAKIFLKVLFPGVSVKSPGLHKSVNVYNRVRVFSFLPTGSAKQFSSGVSDGTIVLFFGATDFNRMLDNSTRIKLLDALHESGNHLCLILQPDDNVDEYNKLKSQYGLNRLSFVQGNLLTIADTISQCSLVISTDSGWLHLANYYGKKTIGLFGFDTLDSWLPPGSYWVKSEICYPAATRYKKSYKNIQPLTSLNIEKVVKLAEHVLNENEKSIFHG